MYILYYNIIYILQVLGNRQIQSLFLKSTHDNRRVNIR